MVDTSESPSAADLPRRVGDVYPRQPGAGRKLLAWTQLLLLDGEMAAAEPKKLRYRLLHVAARITRSASRTRLRIAEGWPWATDLVAAFTRLAALPRPAT